jgi:hypothetical protein
LLKKQYTEQNNFGAVATASEHNSHRVSHLLIVGSADDIQIHKVLAFFAGLLEQPQGIL